MVAEPPRKIEHLEAAETKRRRCAVNSNGDQGTLPDALFCLVNDPPTGLGARGPNDDDHIRVREPFLDHVSKRVAGRQLTIPPNLVSGVAESLSERFDSAPISVCVTYENPPPGCHCDLMRSLARSKVAWSSRSMERSAP